jgi:hypothetical protein
MLSTEALVADMPEHNGVATASASRTMYD